MYVSLNTYHSHQGQTSKHCQYSKKPHNFFKTQCTEGSGLLGTDWMDEKRLELWAYIFTRNIWYVLRRRHVSQTFQGRKWVFSACLSGSYNCWWDFNEAMLFVWLAQQSTLPLHVGKHEIVISSSNYHSGEKQSSDTDVTRQVPYVEWEIAYYHWSHQCL